MVTREAREAGCDADPAISLSVADTSASAWYRVPTDHWLDGVFVATSLDGDLNSGPFLKSTTDGATIL